MFEAPGETGPIGVAETALLVAPQHGDLTDVVTDLFGQVRRAVGASVVDDQDITLRYDLAERAQHRLDVQDLVVRRKNHEGTHWSILPRVVTGHLAADCSEHLHDRA